MVAEWWAVALTRQSYRWCHRWEICSLTHFRWLKAYQCFSRTVHLQKMIGECIWIRRPGCVCAKCTVRIYLTTTFILIRIVFGRVSAHTQDNNKHDNCNGNEANGTNDGKKIEIACKENVQVKYLDDLTVTAKNSLPLPCFNRIFSEIPLIS